VDTWFAVAMVLAMALAIAIVAAVRRGRTIERVQEALRGTGVSRDLGPAAAVFQLRAETRRSADTSASLRADDAALGEALGSGTLRIDGDLQIGAANAAAHEILGRSPGSLAGRSLMEAFLDATVERMAREAIADGAATGEIRLAGQDGPAIAIRARRVADGGAWIVLDDVSELRRLQRIRTEFIDNLSHELRTPLTTVSLLAETLSREVASAGDGVPQRMRDRVLKIEVETGHLVQMVNELLDLSRIEGGGTLEMTDGVDLGGLAARSAERLRLFAERQGVGLIVDPGSGLPTVRGDPERLGQVVVNLVHNAVKFSPDGGDVTVSSHVDASDVVVSVADHGVGIPAAARDRVFERFYKVDRARLRPEVGGGTGLGLAIARHVVEQHGGRIWVESREGGGSTFSFAIAANTANAA
jgi:two-component system, OmpR family, phosphate regulon sensor histidine kinase PhoR